MVNVKIIERTEIEREDDSGADNEQHERDDDAGEEFLLLRVHGES